ncbi:MAG: HTH domain-containing protein [Clostridia bacterium]|nr:HTH domain-containing protein [Clostridia bacterium]
MRSQSLELKKEIYDTVNDWKRSYGYSPSLNDLAKKLNVSRTTVYRYLTRMNEDGELYYNGSSIETKEPFDN